MKQREKNIKIASQKGFTTFSLALFMIKLLVVYQKSYQKSRSFSTVVFSNLLRYTWRREKMDFDDDTSVKALYDIVRRISISKIPFYELDDFVQETVIKIWLSIKRFRGECSLFSWIYRITKDEIFRFYEKHEDRIQESIKDSNQSSESSMEIESVELDTSIRQILGKDYSFFSLRWNDNLSDKGISDHSGLPLGTVKTKLSNIRRKLRMNVNHLI